MFRFLVENRKARRFIAKEQIGGDITAQFLRDNSSDSTVSSDTYNKSCLSNASGFPTDLRLYKRSIAANPG